MKTKTLTLKQEKFCNAYIRLGDKSAAYREAYSCDRMTAKSVNEKASELFNNVKVTSRVNALQAKAAIIAEEKFSITSESILRHLNILSNSRIDDYVEFKVFEEPDGQDEKGNPKTKTVQKLFFKPFDKLTPEQLMCIESIKQNRYGEIELKLHGKEWTIEKINKHIGFYKIDNEQSKPELHVTWQEQKTYEQPKTDNQ